MSSNEKKNDLPPHCHSPLSSAPGVIKSGKRPPPTLPILKKKCQKYLNASKMLVPLTESQLPRKVKIIVITP